MFRKESLKIKDQTILIINNGLIKINYKLTYLTAYIVALANAVILIKNWSSLTEYQVFLCAGLITTGIIGIIIELYFKTYQNKINIQDIENITDRRSIFNLNHRVVKIKLKNGKFRQVYTDLENTNLLLTTLSV
jgi:hypothetical protein